MIAIANSLQDAAEDAAGNWARFDSFVWWEKPENPEEWTVVYTNNRDSGPLDRSNANAIAKEMEKEEFEPDVLPQSHSHWAVGHMDGYAIRVYRDGEITEAFAKWRGLQERLDNYPILDEDLYSREQQEEIDASWDAWVKYDFTRGLEKRFGREVRDDADLFELFYQQEPEWSEDCSGMVCDVQQCVGRVRPEDAEPYLVEAN